MSRVFNTDGIPQQAFRQHLSGKTVRNHWHRLAYAQHVPPKAFLQVIVTTDGVFHDDSLAPCGAVIVTTDGVFHDDVL
eukprot:655987-Hanusia_phi.AAC.1